MTKTIKTNLIRILTLIVAISCAFSILTMPKFSASADTEGVPTVEADYFWVDDYVEFNAESTNKSGLRFTARARYAWVYDGSTADYALTKTYEGARFDFGIVIADKVYYENGEAKERTDISVDTDKAILIEYTKQSDFTGHFTNYIGSYTASITYREDRLKADFVAHDLAAESDEDKYFTDVNNEELTNQEFEAIMDAVHREKLMARAYVKITLDDTVQYLYSANTVTASVRNVATDKYLEYKDTEKWKEIEDIVTQYLGVTIDKSADLDMSTRKIEGVDLRSYEEFLMDGTNLVVGDDIIIDENDGTATLKASVLADKEAGKTYTLTAIDANDNVLFLKTTLVTKIIKTADDFKNVFNLSTSNSRHQAVGSFYTCTVDGYYILGNDINMAGVQLDHNLVCAYNGDTVAPSNGIGFYGTFDGRGYTIKNIDVSRSGAGILQMNLSSDFMQTNGQQSVSAFLEYPAIAEHSCASHSSGSGVGVFGSLGYGATIKNVAFTNAKATNSAFLAMHTEGNYKRDNGATTYNAFDGFEAVDSSNYAWRYPNKTSSTACTGDANCPIHGKNDCTATTGVKYIKCTGKAHCVYHQTTVGHTEEWIQVAFTGSSNDYLKFATDTVYIRKGVNLTAAQAKITYDNIFIDINSETSNFRGVFNSFGASKTDAITEMNNVVVKYDGSALTAENTGILRGENKVAVLGGKGVVFGSTTKNNVIVISKNDANLINYGGTYVANNVKATNTTKIAGILQYSTFNEYLADVTAEKTSIDAFKSNGYWDTDKLGVPYWKRAYQDSISFKVNNEDSNGKMEYSALVDGNEKQYQVIAYNILGTPYAEFDTVETSNEAVATVTKAGLITIAGGCDSEEATAIVKLTIEGKVFTANITLMGGFTPVNDVIVTYSADQGRFDFGGYAGDPDDSSETDNSVVITNANVVSASVIYNGETTVLTNQTIQVKDYGILGTENWTKVPGFVGATSGNRDNNGTADDTLVDFNAFMGDVVKFSVTVEEDGSYTSNLPTQQLLVKVNLGTVDEPIYKTYLFNLKAYTAVINNVARLTEIFNLTQADQLNKGYYVLANSLQPARGGGLYESLHTTISGTSGFQGVFDGQGYLINEATHTKNTGNGKGSLFGVIRSTKEMPTIIKNLSIRQYGSSSTYTTLAESLYVDEFEDVVTPDGTVIKKAKYPVEFYNIHIKPTTKRVHGLFRASAGTVSYRFRNVLMNLENLKNQGLGDPSLLSAVPFGMLLTFTNVTYAKETQVSHMLGFARDAYYTDAYKNVIALMDFPVMSYIASTTANTVNGLEPLDVYYTGYGWNKLTGKGVALSKYTYNASSITTEVLKSQQTFVTYAGTEEKNNTDATPWATEVTTNTYSVEGVDTTYTTSAEQAFFFKGLYQYYNLTEMIAGRTNGTDEEKAMFATMTAEGQPFSIRSDGKLIWTNGGSFAN